MLTPRMSRRRVIGPRRRVIGLQREEVALLAGTSAEYYLRLEQGRDKHPSEQVVEALARALELDHEGLTYALTLARSRTRLTKPAAPIKERVPVGTQMLLDTINIPAFVMNRYRDVLASNPLAVVFGIGDLGRLGERHGDLRTEHRLRVFCSVRPVQEAARWL